MASNEKKSTNIKADIKVGRYRVPLSNLDRIVFPNDDITKEHLIIYYMHVAPLMIAYTKNRLLTMQRWPDGIDQEGFFQKNAQDYFPQWIKRYEVSKKEAGITRYVIANNSATIIYLVNYGCITFHTALSKIDKIMYPDRLIFDLDPSVDDFPSVIWAALELKKILESYDLVPFVMTTGSRGVHVVVPLKRLYRFEQVETFANNCAKILVKKYPKEVTLAFYKKTRKGRIFIDTLRNQYGATAVCPYSIRAKHGAPIAMPLTWNDLLNIKSSQEFTLLKTITTIRMHADPWIDMKSNAGKIV